MQPLFTHILRLKCSSVFLTRVTYDASDATRCHITNDRTLNRKRKPKNWIAEIFNLLFCSLSACLLDRILKAYIFQRGRGGESTVVSFDCKLIQVDEVRKQVENAEFL